jgi:hypothetical protein
MEIVLARVICTFSKGGRKISLSSCKRFLTGIICPESAHHILTKETLIFCIKTVIHSENI